jgi:transcriptional regulator with XRE-family HTH domain
MGIDPAAVEARRREYGAFLRSRRERLTPASVGLPQGFRRRTPGLRREEVALLAGVGATWYAWLEHGRDVRPSAEALSALADALKLDAAERRHLFILNDRPAPETAPRGPERVEQPLRRMLASLTDQPAYVLGRRWDILAWNRAAVALFGDYDALQGDQRNIMHLVFVNEAHRRLLVDWETLARAALAMFRADSARYVGNPEFDRLIALVTRSSREFRQWWSKREVLPPLTGHKRIQHPSGGRMVFEYTSLAVADHADMKLVVYTPLEEDQTVAKLKLLLHRKPIARTSSDRVHLA